MGDGDRPETVGNEDNGAFGLGDGGEDLADPFVLVRRGPVVLLDELRCGQISQPSRLPVAGAGAEPARHHEDIDVGGAHRDSL